MTWYDDACCLQLSGGEATSHDLSVYLHLISTCDSRTKFQRKLGWWQSLWALSGYILIFFYLCHVVTQSSSVKTSLQGLFGWDSFFNVGSWNIFGIFACKAKPPARPCIWLVFVTGLCIISHTRLYMYIELYDTCVYIYIYIYAHTILVDIIWFSCHWLGYVLAICWRYL